MSAEDSKLKSEGQDGGEWDHTITKEEGGTLPAVRDTTVISGKPDAKVSTPCRKKGISLGTSPLKETTIDRPCSVCIYFIPSSSPPSSPSPLFPFPCSPSLFPCHSYVFPFLSPSYTCTLMHLMLRSVSVVWMQACVLYPM